MSTTPPPDFRDAPAGTVAFACLDESPPLLGTLTHLETADGTTRPVFSLWARPSHLPTIELTDDHRAALRFQLADYTLAEFLHAPHRQQLADFYNIACRRFGWVRDEHATLNVIYRLEQAGIRKIDHDNLGRAMHIAHTATQAVYAYVRQFAKLKLAA